MPKVTLTDLEAGYGLKTSYNANNDAIEAAFENTLSRDGSTPNAMAAQLDMNSNKIINLPQGVASTDAVNVAQLEGTVFSNLDVGSTPVVHTYAALTAIAAPSHGDAVFVDGDGIAGLFVFDTAEVTAANGGTIFDADDATVGSWVRRYSGPVHVKWFGAVGDGVVNDSTSIVDALDYCNTLDSFALDFSGGAYRISVTPALWPAVPTALKTFANKKNISFIFNGAEFIDETTYAANEIGKFLRFESCETINFVGALRMQGSRLSTTAGDRRGMEVITILACDGFGGDIYSDGNSTPIVTYEFGFGYSSNVSVRLWSVNSHYCGLLWNVRNVTAEIHSVNGYRTMFIAGLVNADLKVRSLGEVGTSLIKAYSANTLMENVSIDFSFKDRSAQPSAYALAIEFESDTAAVMRNLDIRVAIENGGASPTTTRLIALNNINPVGGAAKTVTTGHKLENVTISGHIDTNNLCEKITFPQVGTFPSGDTIRNISLKDLICTGTGGITFDLPMEGITVWDNIHNPSGLTRVRGVSGDNRVVIQNSLIDAYESSNSEHHNVDYVNTRIATYSAALLPISNRSFVNALIDDSPVNVSSTDLTQRLTKTVSGDLTGAAKSLFRFVGRVRALAFLDYVLVSDNTNPVTTQTHGTIRFFLYNTPGGTCLAANQSAQSAFVGTEAVITLSALNGTNEGFLQFTATNYNSANAFAVFSLRIIPEINNAERFLAYIA